MRKVLLLNNGGEVLDVISWTKAMKLLCKGKAKVLKSYDFKLRSGEQEMFFPSIIMLLNYVFLPFSKKVPICRRNVFLRDKGECQYCGKKLSLNTSTIDHIFPKARGGKHIWKNVVLSCRACNIEKGDKLLKQTKFQLRNKPYTPVREMMYLCYVHKEPYNMWKDFFTSINPV